MQSKLLALIGNMQKGALDAIYPHGPLIRTGSRAEVVARSPLNPQPLPPVAPFLLAAADMAHEVVEAAVAADVRGDSPSASVTAYVTDFVDDWCGTPWSKRWPWPWPGPRPEEAGGRGEWGTGPRPEPWDVSSARVIGAIIFASAASRLSDGDLAAALAHGADQLAEAAVAG